MRYSISFLCHLMAGGQVRDRVTGETVGRLSGRPFDFARFDGGPLFGVRGALPFEHLFVGHTVCPGFDQVAHEVPWWAETPFHVPGYDYFHDGLNYAYTPVDLDDRRFLPVVPAELDRSPWIDPQQRLVLVYRDPLDQVESFYHYCRTHAQPVYRGFAGRRLGEVALREYAFSGALASYAKQFVSYQNMASHRPAQVRLVRYEQLIQRPVETLGDILDFLALGRAVDRIALASAVALARREHLKAIERELGRSLDGTHSVRQGHMRSRTANDSGQVHDGATLRATVIDWLASYGIDPRHFAQEGVPAHGVSQSASDAGLRRVS